MDAVKYRKISFGLETKEIKNKQTNNHTHPELDNKVCNKKSEQVNHFLIL
jgi:hypothetical protein